jgi:hypothetical protein
MHPDFERSRWWAAADNYLAMAHFNFERNPRDAYVWYMLLAWAECMNNLREEVFNQGE